MIRKLFGPLAQRWAWVETAIRTQERFGEVHGSGLAAAVTLSAFLSLFPLLLVTAAVVGFLAAGSTNLAADVIARIGLSGEAASAVTSAIAQAETSRAVAGPIGLAGLLWSGLGLVAAIQFAFDSVWQVGGRGLRDKLVGLLWLAGSGTLLVASAVVTAVTTAVPGVATPLGVVATLAVDTALWLWSMRTLTNRDLPLRAHLPGAVFGAVGLGVLKLVGSVYVPRAVASTSALYGSIGVVFSVISWLFIFGRLSVYASCLNVVRWEEEHGTVTAEVEVPRIPGEVTLTTTRAGEAVPIR